MKKLSLSLSFLHQKLDIISSTMSALLEISHSKNFIFNILLVIDRSARQPEKERKNLERKNKKKKID